MYGVMLLVGTVLSCIALSPNLVAWLKKVPALCSSIKVNYSGITVDTKIVSGLDCDLIAGFATVYRICFGFVCFFMLMSLLMCRVHSSKDPRAHVQNGFWFFKYILVFLFVLGGFFIPNMPFLSIWLVIGFIGAFIFILIQLILLVDFAHSWNQAWVQRYEEDDNKNFCCGLAFFTILFYIFAITVAVLLYVFYASSEGCGLGIFFISFNLILCIIVSVMSVLPSVQEHLPFSGLLQVSHIFILIICLLKLNKINSVARV